MFENQSTESDNKRTNFFIGIFVPVIAAFVAGKLVGVFIGALVGIAVYWGLKKWPVKL